MRGNKLNIDFVILCFSNGLKFGKATPENLATSKPSGILDLNLEQGKVRNVLEPLIRGDPRYNIFPLPKSN